MRCQWQELLQILPLRMRHEVDMQTPERLQELRLRMGAPPEFVCAGKTVHGTGCVTQEELKYTVNTASQYSPWSVATVSQGYITVAGGHRIGICGEVVLRNSAVTGFNGITSLCIRVAKDYPGIAQAACGLKGSVLIIGKPGSGKTTLLRDLIRVRSESCGEQISVIDERRELFPVYHGASCFERGGHTDIMTGCNKSAGIDMVLRTMGPDCIAVDEITRREDCFSIYQAGRCGVSILATAHAVSAEDLHHRPVYKLLMREKIFNTLLVMHEDQSWHTERIA